MGRGKIFGELGGELEITPEHLQSLLDAITDHENLDDLRKQLVSYTDQGTHDASNEIPIEGDHPFIERSE